MFRTLSISTLVLMSACSIDYGFTPDWGQRLRALDCDIEDSTGASEEERPVAVCDASAYRVAAIWETVELIDESYDPNDVPLIDRHWQVVEAPEGSVAQVRQNEDGKPVFTPDLVGTYVINLSVINENCIESGGCNVTIEAIPDEDLWVEMYWQNSGDDMDLHLIQDSAPFESDGDCYYANCVRWDGEWGLDWGIQGVGEDNPALDLDDIDGTGPENINIFRPAGSTYQVVVHDFPGSVRQRPNDVTVRIYLHGELRYQETKTIEGEDSRTPFATIDWANNEVIPR